MQGKIMKKRNISIIYNFIFFFLISCVSSYSSNDTVNIGYKLDIEGLKIEGNVSCYRGRVCDVKIYDNKTISFYLSKFYNHLSSRIKCSGTPCLLQEGYDEPRDVHLLELDKLSEYNKINSILRIYYGEMTKSLEYRPIRYVGILTLEVSSAGPR
jgi:hypothetical protein